ncbi:MAG: C25 family cysteine peptidase [Euryarchaeota archaeon]|nr:C25 family cysteine peptidase [Euryarchaeota archaeon]
MNKHYIKTILKTTLVITVLLILIGSVFTSARTIQTKTAKSHNPTTDATLLIIAPKTFAKELQPLVTHKEKIGLPTRLVILDQIYKQSSNPGRDNAEKIKYFIKSSIEESGTRYVLLVGGKIGQLPFWYLPVRYAQMNDSWESEYLTDLYYADIYDSHDNFSSWDTDKDNLYGEWPDDKNIDLYPDVAVGRIPCRNGQEVKIMVNKIIDYETNTYGKPWFSDLLVVAGDTYPESDNANWTGYEGEYYGDRAIENMTAFTPTRLYTSLGNFNGESDVITAFNKGYGFVYLVGHGNPKSWGNHPPDNASFIKGLTTNTMHKLDNQERLPICVVSGCHNSQFDVSLFKVLNKRSRYVGENAYECWGWRMTRKIGGGSIATIGCTALGYTKEDKQSFKGGLNEIETMFFHDYGEHHVSILGDVWKDAIHQYIDNYPVNWSGAVGCDSWVDTKVVQSWVLFGDPSLCIGGYP